jgi:hypothetical protein
MSNTDFKEGSRVQSFNKNNSTLSGTIENIIQATKPRVDFHFASKEDREAMTVHANVIWDDGTKDKVDIYCLENEDSELERQFRVLNNTASIEIESKLDEARKALRDATDISEKYGVPFGTSISFIYNEYIPNSFNKGDLDQEFINSVTDTYNEFDCAGWRYSSASC